MKYVDYTRISRAPDPPTGPMPAPVVSPVPAPVPVIVHTVPVGLQWAIVGLVVLVLLLGGVVAHDHFIHWPNPWPEPVPTPVTGPLRVIILYESKDALPAGQIDILHSTAIRAYLDTHCMKDGVMPAYRVWDKDVDATSETTSWQAPLATAKANPLPVPKICIFTAAGYRVIVPLPADEQATLDLLKKYGG